MNPQSVDRNSASNRDGQDHLVRLPIGHALGPSWSQPQGGHRVAGEIGMIDGAVKSRRNCQFHNEDRYPHALGSLNQQSLRPKLECHRRDHPHWCPGSREGWGVRSTTGHQTLVQFLGEERDGQGRRRLRP